MRYFCAERNGVRGNTEIQRLFNLSMNAIRQELETNHAPLKGDVTVLDTLLNNIPNFRLARRQLDSLFIDSNHLSYRLQRYFDFAHGSAEQIQAATSERCVPSAVQGALLNRFATGSDITRAAIHGYVVRFCGRCCRRLSAADIGHGDGNGDGDGDSNIRRAAATAAGGLKRQQQQQ